MKIKTLFLVFLCLLAGLLFTHTFVYADEDYEKLYDKIEEYEKKITKLQAQEKSLKNEIAYSDSQINLTLLRIQSTNIEINKKTKEIQELASDIQDLKVRIQKLTESISFQGDLLQKRLRVRYKTQEASPVVIFLGSDTLNKIVQKFEYLKVIQLQDQKLLDQMESTKASFAFQKDIFVDKKREEEELKKQIEAEKANLEIYNSNLERQKKDKQTLLKKTENDESKYQSLLAQVKSELAALQLAIDLPAGEGEEIDKGDVLGFMGNTGCSSGPHVHFGYVDNGKAKDPLPYLNEGKLKWPVDNYAITQYFGENFSFYMNNFGIPGHDALDIISTTQWSGAPVKAAKDGILYYAQDDMVYCPWLNGSLGKGAIIDHGDGERTIYWHLQ